MVTPLYEWKISEWDENPQKNQTNDFFLNLIVFINFMLKNNTVNSFNMKYKIKYFSQS